MITNSPDVEVAGLQPAPTLAGCAAGMHCRSVPAWHHPAESPAAPQHAPPLPPSDIPPPLGCLQAPPKDIATPLLRLCGLRSPLDLLSCE